MWPFRNRVPMPEPKEKEDIPPPFKIGERVWYLGISMVVVANHYVIDWMAPALPAVVCEFLDERGHLKQRTFLPFQYKALIQENKRGLDIY